MAKKNLRLVYEENGRYYTNVWDPARKKRIRRAAGTNKRRAEEIALELRAKIGQDDFQYQPKRKAAKLDTYIPKFLEDNYAGKETYQDARRSLLRFMAYMGNLPLHSISRRIVKDFVARRKKDPPRTRIDGRKIGPATSEFTEQKFISPLSIDRELSYIHYLLSCAVEDKLIAVNPMGECMKIVDERTYARNRTLQPSEFSLFLKWVDESESPVLQDFVWVDLYLGRRPREILRLRTEQYDRRDDVSIVNLGRTKKGGWKEIIQVIGLAKEILDRRYDEAVKAKCDWLFPNESNTGPIHSVRTAFQRVLRKTGIKNFQLRDIRRTSISNMLMDGISPFVVAKLVGHTTTKMIEEVYGHLYDKHVQSVLQQFTRHMNNMTGHTPPIPPTGMPGPESTPDSGVRPWWDGPGMGHA